MARITTIIGHLFYAIFHSRDTGDPSGSTARTAGKSAAVGAAGCSERNVALNGTRICFPLLGAWKTAKPSNKAHVFPPPGTSPLRAKHATCMA